jgi:two-component system cell cycle sensor histidine kinase/response regulator CckA
MPFSGRDPLTIASPRPLSRLSLEWKLPIAICALLVIVTVTLSWIAYAHVERSARQAAAARLQSLSEQLVQQLAQETRAFGRQTLAVANAHGVQAMLRQKNPATEAAARQDLDAAMRDTAVLAIDVRDSAGARLLIAGRAAASLAPLQTRDASPTGPGDARVGGLQLIHDTLVFPIVALAERGAGTVVLWRQLRRDPKAREQIEAVLGPGSTFYIGTPGGLWTDQQRMVRPPPFDVRASRGTITYRRPGLGTRIAWAGAVPDNAWSLVLEFPESLVLGPARSFLRRMVLAGTILLGAGFLATWWASRRITNPLRELTAAAAAISEGNYDGRVDIAGADELARLAIAFNAMSERIDDEVTARSRSEDQWRTLFESNPQPMWVYDIGSLRFLAVNDAAVRQYGYSKEEFLARSVTDIRPPEDVPGLRQTIADERRALVMGRATRHRKKDGSDIDVEVSSHAIEFGGRPARLVLGLDVSARKALESQLRQSQKMEAVGRLAGGVAHDFNNLLTVMMTYADLVRAELPDGDPRAADLDVIIRTTTQAHGLTRQLLAFSRQQVLQPVVVDPAVAITDLSRMLRRVIGEDVKFSTDLDPAAGAVRVDRGQLDQVILNLVVNARDAMPDGGCLTIRTRPAAVSEELARIHGMAAGTRCVAIEVSDTGTGMSAETRARIFEPFFTTKEVGKGTGLGLATVYGIVKQSGGFVTVASVPGEGSVFSVFLPCLDEHADRPGSNGAERPVPRGAEHILLVEDDAAVRNVTTAVLKRNGYTVLAAPQGDAALDLLKDAATRVDMVITDVVMPGMDGPELLTRLRELRPGLRAMFISGYAGDAIVRRGVLESGVPFLEKPYTVKALTQRVREVLDGPDPLP